MSRFLHKRETSEFPRKHWPFEKKLADRCTVPAGAARCLVGYVQPFWKHKLLQGAVASCSWFDGFCTQHHCISDQGRMAMCGAKRRYLEVYRVPKLLYELLFTKLARRTDTSLVASPWCVTQTTETITFRSVSNFQTTLAEACSLTLCIQLLEYGTFC